MPDLMHLQATFQRDQAFSVTSIKPLKAAQKHMRVAAGKETSHLRNGWADRDHVRRHEVNDRSGR